MIVIKILLFPVKVSLELMFLNDTTSKYSIASFTQRAVFASGKIAFVTATFGTGAAVAVLHKGVSVTSWAGVQWAWAAIMVISTILASFVGLALAGANGLMACGMTAIAATVVTIFFNTDVGFKALRGPSLKALAGATAAMAGAVVGLWYAFK